MKKIVLPRSLVTICSVLAACAALGSLVGGCDDTSLTTADPSLDCTEAAFPGAVPPTRLRCAGLFADWSRRTVAATNRAFAPAVPLWSDGAQKRRWVSLPEGTQIDTSDMNEWTFPVGTKFWKEFSFNGKPVETRLWWKVGLDDWVRTTYRWTADQSDAVRFDGGDKNVDVGRPTAYEIPSADDCANCHQGRRDKILGFEAVNLGLPGATGVTLATLVAEGRLSTVPPSTSLAIQEDSTGHAAAALGYLHSNCGTTCHNRNEDAFCNFSGMFLRLRYEDVVNPNVTVADHDAWKTTVGIPATFAGPGFLRIAPGNVAGSGIAYLMSRRVTDDSGTQMPPIDTHAIDEHGIATVTAWIAGLAPR